MQKKMGLIGSGISKSKMPRLQMHLGEITNIDLDYMLIDSNGITGFDPKKEIVKCRNNHFHGINITHPYKKIAWDIVTKAHDITPPIGAYNTIKFTGSEMYGANTDYSGFIHAYKNKFGSTIPGNVLLVGAGGAGHAVAFALLDIGVQEIAILDNSIQQATNLRDLLIRQGAIARTITAGELCDTMLAMDGLINCTPVGMYNHPGNVFPEACIKKQRWAFDVVYTPIETEFFRACKSKDIAFLNGFELWFFQGLDAFKIFTGIEVEPDKNLFNETLAWLEY